MKSFNFQYDFIPVQRIRRNGKREAFILLSGITSLWYTATIDIKYIKDLLGHYSIKTALRYLHVTNKDLVNILSPIEDIKDFL